MRVRGAGLAAAVLAAAAAAAPAASQDVDLRGQWTADEGGRTCQLRLGDRFMFGNFGASSFGCGPGLIGVTGYRVSGRELVLTGIADAELARLRLQDDQLVGSTKAGVRVTLSRAGAAPVLRQPGPDWSAIFGRRDCVWRRDAARCAQPDELRTPAPGARVQVLDLLNLRAEPGFRSGIVTELPPGACLAVGECRTGTDGLWCAAEWQGRRGWVVKTTPRENRQNLTYVDGCGGAAG